MNDRTTLQDADDEVLSRALAEAHVPALMAAITHITGSTEHLRGAIRPVVIPLAEEEDGLTEDQRNEARALALQLLRNYRDAGCPPLTAPDDAKIEETMAYVTGTPIPAEQKVYMREELNLFGEDRRRVEIPSATIPANFRVLIIGAGMSGILAAVRLRETGIPFLMVEKNPEIGGTWYENTYPGCQVDSANHLYNYSFAPEHQWPGHFSAQPELLDYFRRVVETHELRQNLQLDTAVHEARFDEQENVWVVTMQTGDGGTRKESFAVVISGCGQLNSPALPNIPGTENFAGVSFHSARWEHKHDLQGKRVAVIGTGCSATQFVPAIADLPGQLDVYQRSAAWLLPAEDYRQPMSDAELWCFRNIPYYARWYRFFLFRARGNDGLLPFLIGEEGWQEHPASVGPANAELRVAMEDYIREQCGDDSALAEALIPTYPPGGKRPVLDDGKWIEALRRPGVNLVTEPIQRIEADGIRTTDGQLHECDVLIYGTGFSADKFLHTMKVTGRGGRDLQQQWRGNPTAYLGATIPGFPNFYCLYGPNTNIVVGSSIIFFSECSMRYIMGCLKLQFEEALNTLEVKPDVCEQYNCELDEYSRLRAWGSPHVDSWYKNAAGRVTQNWPGTHWEWWHRTSAPVPEDFLRE
ncbi:MAG: NAD(P)/FAD-dependent oxidoreductase [Halioglobus sp.]